MDADPTLLTLTELAALIARRRLSAVELVAAYLERIRALDGHLAAYIAIDEQGALKTARAAQHSIDARGPRGPLDGIPFALKDVFDSVGFATTGNSRVGIGRVAARDATVVARLREAGAVLLGKLAAHEFASGGPSLDLPWPPARNPWHTAHFTGGSSSGPGAAVAASLCAFALGTDAGGSVRIPAALCGVVGLKPTYGRVSRAGTLPGSFTFDHTGPLARTAADCALVLQAIAGHDSRDAASSARPVPGYGAAIGRGIEGTRVGVIAPAPEDEERVDPRCRAALDDAVDVLRRLGARIGIARMRPLRKYNDVMMLIAKAETLAIHLQDLQARPDDFGLDFVARTVPACLFQASDYVNAQRERGRMIAEMDALYRDFDVLVTATSSPAPRLASLVDAGYVERWRTPNIYCQFNITGGPALSVCSGFTSGGLPLGIQIAGRPFDEMTVLSVADAYERATGWHRRRPPLPAPPELLFSRPAETSTVESSPLQALVDASLAGAGIVLRGRRLELVHRIAPAALAVADRLRQRRDPGDEPADVHCFTDRLVDGSP